MALARETTTSPPVPSPATVIGVALPSKRTLSVDPLLEAIGVDAINENRLRDALATRQSSKIPWSKKYFFDRSRFDADLKRIQAFYADRGFPDARVTGFDVKLNDKQDEVDLTVTIAEGVRKTLEISVLRRIELGLDYGH